MKIFKYTILHDQVRTVYGIKYPFFSMLYETESKQYYYYLNAPFLTSYLGYNIFKSKNKSKYLNKCTLNLLGILYTMFMYCAVVVFFIFLPFLNYLQGGKNFIRDGFNATMVRYFNIVNIFIIFILMAYILISKI